jgi:hypothetical protein
VAAVELSPMVKRDFFFSLPGAFYLIWLQSRGSVTINFPLTRLPRIKLQMGGFEQPLQFQSGGVDSGPQLESGSSADRESQSSNVEKVSCRTARDITSGSQFSFTGYKLIRNVERGCLPDEGYSAPLFLAALRGLQSCRRRIHSFAGTVSGLSHTAVRRANSERR